MRYVRLEQQDVRMAPSVLGLKVSVMVSQSVLIRLTRIQISVEVLQF